MAPAATDSLHLASASPRRRQILAALGLEHTWSGVDIDETPRAGEAPDRLARRLASAKASAARERGQSARFVLAADTVVALGGQMFGKPASREEALEMLALLSGRSHEVLTAVALSADGRELSALSVTTVKFREIDAAEASAYWETGEPRGKAGAYAVQGKAGIFVESLTGSYSGVVGLPVFETAGLLRQAGFALIEPMRSRDGS
jgi:septum formation protein